MELVRTFLVWNFLDLCTYTNVEIDCRTGKIKNYLFVLRNWNFEKSRGSIESPTSVPLIKKRCEKSEAEICCRGRT